MPLLAKSFQRFYPKRQTKLKNLFTTGKSTSSPSSLQPKDEYLLILTCDRLAILKGDPATEGSVHGASVHGNLSGSSSSFSHQENPSNPPFVSIPLSLLKGAHTEGSTLVVEHYLPALGSKQQPSSPTGAAAAVPSTNSNNNNALNTSSTSSSSSLLFNDDGTFSFPLISASVAAISKLRRGDGSGTGQAVLRLHADSEETAMELAKAVHTALQRLLNALLWLDRVILTRAPAWGSAVNVPSSYYFGRATPTDGNNNAPSVSVNIDICTPLGPCHAVIPLQKLLSLPADDELTVEAVCSSEAQRVAGSLNLSASVTIGNVVVGSTTTSTRIEGTSVASKERRNVDAAGYDVFFAGCIGAALALFGATVISGLRVNLPLACLGIFIFVVMLFLQKKKETRGSASSAAAAVAAATSQGKDLKEIKIVESFSLLHAEIIEGPGEDFSELPSTALPQHQPQKQKQLARQLTASLAKRDSYLQRSTSVTATTAASPPSFGRLKSLKLIQHQQPSGGGGALVDIGAVSMRRVVSSSVSTTTMTAVIEEHVQIKLPPSAEMESHHEAEVLAKLHAISPAITPELFHRYTKACGGDRKKALTRLKATAEWRANNGIDEILTSPVPRFKAIKAAYLHSVIGWTKDNTMPVVVEGMGSFKKALLQLHKDNITPAEMIQQFIFVLEWVLNDLTRDKAGSFVRIYDLKGISLFDLADKQAIALGQQMMDLLEKYYPERMAKAFVVNTPSFFATAWKMVKPMLDPRTAQKIQVLSSVSHAHSALLELMEDEVIPVAYGGKNPITGYEIGFCGGWYEGEVEKKLSVLADELNNQ
ncbi:hypothetical protein Ndes2437B_g06878 [Nannochloris sp. 'desiccata']